MYIIKYKNNIYIYTYVYLKQSEPYETIPYQQFQLSPIPTLKLLWLYVNARSLLHQVALNSSRGYFAPTMQ